MYCEINTFSMKFYAKVVMVHLSAVIVHLLAENIAHLSKRMCHYVSLSNTLRKHFGERFI